MKWSDEFKKLCTPAYVYLVLSIIGLIFSLIQNFGSKKTYKLGLFIARVPSTLLVFVVKIIYILFWTWILNLICRDGHTGIAWFLVLIPFILLFVIVGLVMVSPKVFEGYKGAREVLQKGGAWRNARNVDFNAIPGKLAYSAADFAVNKTGGHWGAAYNSFYGNTTS